MVFEHPYLHVRLDTVREADGTENEYIVAGGPDIAYAVPVWPDGTVSLNRQRRHAMRGRSLEVPGGHCDPGEAPAVAARRELREETGLVARDVTHLLTFIPQVKVQQSLHVFLATGLRQRKHARDADEDIEVVRMPLEKAARLALTGRVKHGPSIVAILAAREHVAP